jgi:hypothetical protein
VSSFDEVCEVDWCRLAGARVKSRSAQKTQAAGRREADTSGERCGRSTENVRDVMDRMLAVELWCRGWGCLDRWMPLPSGSGNRERAYSLHIT